MISVIIPCYNASKYLWETLESIISQNEMLEIIIVDDGSTDNSAAIVKEFDDDRIKYLFQKNHGVSVARNKGLKTANGEFVIFFDADDKMTSGFLKHRKKALDQDPGIDFCCGPVISFPVEKEITFGVAENVVEKLLTYQPQYSSCPSNYLIRKSVLTDNNLFFHEKLSSTADRFFLIELANRSKGILIDQSPLLYRITPNSMSAKLSKILVEDNEQYFFELKKNNLIPFELEKDFFFRIQYILGLGFIRTGSYIKGMKYTSKAFFGSPKKFLNQIF